MTEPPIIARRSDYFRAQWNALAAEDERLARTVMLAGELIQGVNADDLIPLMRSWFDELVPTVNHLAATVVRIDQHQLEMAQRLDQLAVQFGALGYDQRRIHATVDDLLRWRDATLQRLATIEQQLDALRAGQP